jgi:galactose-1-phosphate uridylyltransferase family 2
MTTALETLLDYAEARGLSTPEDRVYCRNRILAVLRLDSDETPAWGSNSPGPDAGIDDILAPILDDAAARGVLPVDTVTQRDLLDTAVMGALVSAPSVVNEKFHRLREGQPESATDWFYALGIDSNYIRKSRTDKNITWRHPSRYGEIDMTINLSKPEKDPRDIAALVNAKAGDAYPACLLCVDNEGYAGRADHPARQNLRLVPVPLAGEDWRLQYSPYVYYNEHCIVLSAEHRPMKIERATLVRLADFVDALPHYFVGSNADLPIVGGSILNHDHFQGGRYVFPIEGAAATANWSRSGIELTVLDWPLTVLRLTSRDRDQLIDESEAIINAWRGWDEPECDVLAYSGETPHNTVTPIARRSDGAYQFDLVLRNNRTTDEHPDGIFHPHAEIHPVKRENIGLIEVMGLAVLPARLEQEMTVMARWLAGGGDIPDEVSAHAPMLAELAAESGTGSPADRVRDRVSEQFVKGLEHCGVFGQSPQREQAAARFLNTLGWEQVQG